MGREDSAAEPAAPSGFFVLRTPLLPFDELEAWGSGAEGDRALLRQRLRGIVERAEVREAIFVSSPRLERLIESWTADPDSVRGAQCERALVRFVSRMAGRPTPFGLFAGIATGRLADETHLGLDGPAGYRRHTRLDADYLVAVVEGLLAEPEIRAHTPVRPNPTLYQVARRRRYMRSRPGAEAQRHLLMSVRDSRPLTHALEAAAAGATPPQIAESLTGTGIDPERAARFVDTLVEEQVLVPDLDVQVTGADAVHGLASAAPPLAVVRDELAKLDAEPLGVSPHRYQSIASVLEPLPAALDLNRLFQVDLTVETRGTTLSREVAEEILKGVSLLRRVAKPHRDLAMEQFADRFRERFEEQAVPLLEALDPDIGIGFDEISAPAPLLAGLRERGDGEGGVRWESREAYLLGRLLDIQLQGARELVLDAVDLSRVEHSEIAPIPDAFAAFAAVAAASVADVSRGRFRVIMRGVDGPPGARLLGRFCQYDAQLRAAVEDHLRAEEALDPDAVFAEIVHLPRARDVNVVARPVLRLHEIPCLGRSGASPERQLTLDDLLVSVEDGVIVLRSKRLGRRVVPRLTTAHNYWNRGVAVYRFLCRLHGAGAATAFSFWGPLQSAPFLPRVRAGRIVLERARWSVGADQLGRTGDRDRESEALREWCSSRGVPRFVVVADDELELPVDLENLLAVDSLVQILRSRGSITLVELCPSPDELCVEGPQGRFVHELVVPFVRVREPHPVATRHRPQARVRRTFLPGSEWLYVRIYTGETSADLVLCDELSLLVQDLEASRSADRWFFLRFRDANFHLRVRFHGDPARLNAEVLPEVQRLGSILVERSLAWRIELGTYEREVERYGGQEGIELAERVFHADSEAVLEVLSAIRTGEQGQAERWRLGLAGAHYLLVDLGLDEEERLALVRDRRDALTRTLRWDADARGRVGDRFRRERPNLEELLDPAPGRRTPLEPGLKTLRDRSRVLAPLGKELARLDRDGGLTKSRASIAGNLMHMHLNRLLRGDNLAQEAVICEFLARLYEGALRRPRATTTRVPRS